MKTTRNKKRKYLDEVENLLRLESNYFENLSGEPSSDHGCFVFINSPIERFGSIYFVKRVFLVHFDQKMGGKTLMFMEIFFEKFFQFCYGCLF